MTCTSHAGKMSMKWQTALFAALVLVSGCATTAEPTPGDPLEGWNRGVTKFNGFADKAALGPLSTAYGTVVPGFARQGVDNALSNLGEPVTAINSALQGKPERALDASWRFIVNSTIGIGGLLDPATEMGLEPHTEDFGQTLAVWGVPEGPYLVLPLMGPSTVRDTAAFPAGAALNPLSYAEYGNDEDLNLGVRAGLGVLTAINLRHELSDQLERLESQPDPYSATRFFYLSQRRAAIRDGAEAEEETSKEMPDFDAYFFEDEEDEFEEESE